MTWKKISFWAQWYVKVRAENGQKTGFQHCYLKICILENFFLTKYALNTHTQILSASLRILKNLFWIRRLRGGGYNAALGISWEIYLINKITISSSWTLAKYLVLLVTENTNRKVIIFWNIFLVFYKLGDFMCVLSIFQFIDIKLWT